MEATSTKTDIMGNMEAMQREHSRGAKIHRGRADATKMKVEELEDELDRVLGSRENERAGVERKVDQLVAELEESEPLQHVSNTVSGRPVGEPSTTTSRRTDPAGANGRREQRISVFADYPPGAQAAAAGEAQGAVPDDSRRRRRRRRRRRWRSPCSATLRLDGAARRSDAAVL